MRALRVGQDHAVDRRAGYVVFFGAAAGFGVWMAEVSRRRIAADFDAFYPTSLLVTGFDILFFWVARMIMLGCWFSTDVADA